MVSIAVCEEQSMPEHPQHASLRCAALWYPDVPPPAINLNENAFVPLSPYTWGFKPLFWTRFGRPGGVYLQHLLRLIVNYVGHVTRLDFSFDTEVPPECRRFGRREETDYGELIGFPIDGPGGEIIDRVKIWQEYPREGANNGGWRSEEGELGRLKV